MGDDLGDGNALQGRGALSAKAVGVRGGVPLAQVDPTGTPLAQDDTVDAVRGRQNVVLVDQDAATVGGTLVTSWKEIEGSVSGDSLVILILYSRFAYSMRQFQGNSSSSVSSPP